MLLCQVQNFLIVCVLISDTRDLFQPKKLKPTNSIRDRIEDEGQAYAGVISSFVENAHEPMASGAIPTQFSKRSGPLLRNSGL